MNTEFNRYPEDTREAIEVPAPTAWPVVLAFGLTLVFAGFVTAAPVSILGAVIAVVGAGGWFRQVLPVESIEWEPVVREEIAIRTERETVARIAGVQAVPRAWLPVEIYPISAGMKGGIAGGAVMAVLAAVYGIVSGNGIWYPMNLLVAGLFPGMELQTPAQIGTFNLQQFLVAVPIHLLISLLVGLLYGAMLPMLPRQPDFVGRFRGSAALVRPDLRGPLRHQSCDEPAHRLALVRALADRIRNYGGTGGCAPGTNPYAPKCTADGPHGNRSARTFQRTPAGAGAMKYGVLILAAILGASSCGAPAQRSVEAPVIRPSEVADFRVLYGQNCSGCHGAGGRGSADRGNRDARVPRHRR